MKILCISDIHGNTKNLDKLDAQFKEADAVVFAGDFAVCFKPETSKPTMEALLKKHDTIFAVCGNCDDGEFIQNLEDNDICAERTLVFHEGLVICGSGGGTKFTGKTANERDEEDILSDFDILTQQEELDGSNVIMIMHNPPKDTKCDRVTLGVHVGSQKLRKLIEKVQPLAVVTGHIHESKSIDKIGQTTVINPGALDEGNYAWLEIEKTDGKWGVKNSSLEKI